MPFLSFFPFNLRPNPVGIKERAYSLPGAPTRLTPLQASHSAGQVPAHLLTYEDDLPNRGTKSDAGGFDWQAYSTASPKLSPSKRTPPTPPAKPLAKPPRFSGKETYVDGSHLNSRVPLSPASSNSHIAGQYVDYIKTDAAGGFDFEKCEKKKSGSSDSEDTTDSEEEPIQERKGKQTPYGNQGYEDIVLEDEKPVNTEIAPCRLINFHELVLKKQIGAGSFGTVYKVTSSVHNS